MMELRCPYVSADQGADQIFQVLFEEKPEEEEGPYLLISRAFLEGDEGEVDPVYIETHDVRLNGHHPTVITELTRSRFTVTLPAPASETVKVHFTASDREFRRIVRTLEIVLQKRITV